MFVFKMNVNSTNLKDAVGQSFRRCLIWYYVFSTQITFFKPTNNVFTNF